MDTNASISNFISPVNLDPSRTRSESLGLDIGLSMPPFLFVMAQDVFIETQVSSHLIDPSPILQARVDEDALEADTDARSLIVGAGRPLWAKMSEGKTIQQTVDLVKGNLLANSPAVKNLSILTTLCGDSVIFSLAHYALLAIRIQASLPSRCDIPTHLVRHSYATLTGVSPDHSSAYCIYLAEPTLAAAAASLMRQGRNAEIALKQLLAAVTLYGVESGTGGELVAMLTAVAASDSLTMGHPYLAVNCGEFLTHWLGLNDDDIDSFPLEVRSGLISLGQFVYASLSPKPSGPLMERGRIYGVGFIPKSRTNLSFDIMLPFEETTDGHCCVILAQIKTAKQFGGEVLKNVQTSLLSACSNLEDSWPIASVDPPVKRIVYPLLLSLGTDKVYYIKSIHPHIDQAGGKTFEWGHKSMKLTAKNSWNQKGIVKDIRRVILGFSSTYEQTEWQRIAKKFKLDVNSVRKLTSKWFLQM